MEEQSPRPPTDLTDASQSDLEHGLKICKEDGASTMKVIKECNAYLAAIRGTRSYLKENEDRVIAKRDEAQKQWEEINDDIVMVTQELARRKVVAEMKKKEEEVNQKTPIQGTKSHMKGDEDRASAKRDHAMKQLDEIYKNMVVTTEELERRKLVAEMKKKDEERNQRAAGTLSTSASLYMQDDKTYESFVEAYKRYQPLKVIEEAWRLACLTPWTEESKKESIEFHKKYEERINSGCVYCMNGICVFDDRFCKFKETKVETEKYR
jgi:hypothetical protein